ncbi:hypothetical protein DFH28DRAFT_687025 [Melampsora americana]|nr:hypothetical protein DFH28DRAFT_687025 [Melampsora americana]
MPVLFTGCVWIYLVSSELELYTLVLVLHLRSKGEIDDEKSEPHQAYTVMSKQFVKGFLLLISFACILLKDHRVKSSTASSEQNSKKMTYILAAGSCYDTISKS